MIRVVALALCTAFLAAGPANAGPFCQGDPWAMAGPDATFAAVICRDGDRQLVQP
jgi:hypothetical protein